MEYLSAQLSRAWIAFAIEADNLVEAAAPERAGRLFKLSLAFWANGLRWVDDDGTTVADLQARAHARCNLGGLERWGWIEVPGERRKGFGTHSGLNPDTVIRPTRAGRYACKAWPRAVIAVEKRWRERFGGVVIDELEQALRGSLGAASADLPWAPPEVKSSDGFRTHVIDGDPTTEPVPFAALLAQALTARTLAYERHTPLPLPVAANVLRVLAGAQLTTRELADHAGISREAAAMAAGFVGRAQLADATEGVLALSAAGRAELDRYHGVERQGDDPALGGALDAVLSQTDALGSGLEPPPGGWRTRRRYSAQTQRFVTDPLGSLPWQPMVLHRGGWPDGS